MTEIKQEDLIEQLKKGDPLAFDYLYERYWKMLFSLACRRTDDEETAKDIVQNVFISVWQKRESLELRTNIEYFLLGAVRFQVFKYFRSESVKQRVLQEGIKKMEELASHMHELFPYIELESLLEKEVNALPENMKQAFLLRSDNYSIKEISAALNIAEQTASNNISEALKKLRKSIALRYPERLITSLVLVFALLNKH